MKASRYTPQQIAQAIKICEIHASASHARQVDSTDVTAEHLDYPEPAAFIADAAMHRAMQLYDRKWFYEYTQREVDAEAAQQLRQGWQP